MLCDFQAIRYLGAGVSRVMLFGFPLVVMLLETVVDRHTPPRRRLLGFAVAWCGLGLVALGAGGTRDASFGIGVFFAIVSMSLYGVAVWSTARLGRVLGSAELTLVSNTATGLVIVLGLFFYEGGAVPPITQTPLLWVTAMVLLSTVIPYFAMNEGIGRLGASRASLVAMLGPPITILSGWAILGETLSLLQWIGSAAVLIGVSTTQQR
jgi:drug/metabolite transporter (DMT)-like permease